MVSVELQELQINHTTGVISSLDTKQVTKDLVHEMMEAVIAYHTGAAFEIQDVVISFLTETKGTEFVEDWLENYRDAYEKAEGSKTTAEAKVELVNDHVGVLFSTEEGMKEFCDWILDTNSITDTKKKDIIQALKKMLDNVVDFFKRFLNYAKDNEVLVAAAQTDYETAKAIRKLVLDAFDKVSQTLEKGGVEGDAETSKGEVRNSIEVKDSKYLEKIKPSDIKRDYIDVFDEDQYNRYGWTIVNGIATMEEYLRAKEHLGVMWQMSHDKRINVVRDPYSLTTFYFVGGFTKFNIIAAYKANVDNYEDLLEAKDYAKIERTISKYGKRREFGSAVRYLGTTLGRRLVNGYSRDTCPDYGQLQEFKEVGGQASFFVRPEYERRRSNKNNNRIGEEWGGIKNSLEITDHTITQSMLEKLDENIVESKEQKDALKEYKERNAQILKNNELLKKARAEKRRLEKHYKNDASAKAEIDALNEKIKKLADTNNRQYRRLAELESTKAIRDLVRQSTKQAVIKQKQKGAERLANYREGRSKTEIRRKIERSIGRINHLLRHGTRERNVKTDLQDVAGEIVSLGHLLFKDVYDNEDIVEAVLMDRDNQLKEVQKSHPVGWLFVYDLFFTLIQRPFSLTLSLLLRDLKSLGLAKGLTRTPKPLQVRFGEPLCGKLSLAFSATLTAAALN